MNSKTEDDGNGRKRAEGTLSFGVSGFPIAQWLDWDKDCKDNFGDCRWIKMWNDHLVSKYYQNYMEIQDRLKSIETEVKQLKENKKESTSVKTLKGELKGD